MESLINAAPARMEPGWSLMVLTSCCSRRSTTARALRARSDTTAVAPRVATLTGITSDAPTGTVEIWVGAVTGTRLRVAPVVLSTTTISSGGAGGGAVSAQAVSELAARASLSRGERWCMVQERSNHSSSVASRLELEAHPTEHPSRPAGKADNLVVCLIEQILDPK